MTLVFLGGNHKSIDAITDQDGCFHVSLMPGPRYSLVLSSSRRLLKDVGEMEVESGRNTDVGDLPLDD
jgi:hypothetical protein